MSGDAVTAYLSAASQTACALRYRDIRSAGSALYELTCSAGGHAATVPVQFTVLDVTMPQDMLVTQSVFTAEAGEEIAVPMPQLLPADTELSADAFDFVLMFPGGERGGYAALREEGGLHVCRFDTPGHYQARIWMMISSNIAFYHPLLFIITDAAGSVPGSPLALLPERVEETIYLDGNISDLSLAACTLANPKYALGAPEWTLTRDAGDAAALETGNADDSGCGLLLTGMAHAGDASFTLRCEAGGYGAAIPVLVHVSDASVPTGMVVEAADYTAAAGETILVRRPVLTPAGTGLDPNLFDFSIVLPTGLLGESLVSRTSDALGLRFAVPGYYPGKITMRRGNVGFAQDVLFRITDASGSVPGHPFRLTPERIETTVYLRGNWYLGWIAYAELLSGLDAPPWPWEPAYFGDPAWTLEGVSGDAMVPAIEADPPERCELYAHEPMRTGDVSGVIRCDSGGFSATVPFLVHVSDAAVPERMETSDRYAARVGEIAFPAAAARERDAAFGQPVQPSRCPGPFRSVASWEVTRRTAAVSLRIARHLRSHPDDGYPGIRIDQDVLFDIASAPCSRWTA